MVSKHNGRAWVLWTIFSTTRIYSGTNLAFCFAPAAIDTGTGGGSVPLRGLNKPIPTRAQGNRASLHRTVNKDEPGVGHSGAHAGSGKYRK